VRVLNTKHINNWLLLWKFIGANIIETNSISSELLKDFLTPLLLAATQKQKVPKL